MSDIELKTGACPDEIALNGYLTRSVPSDVAQEVERHVSNCQYCTFKIAEAYASLKESAASREGIVKTSIKPNIWALLCLVMFVLSFFFSEHFIQFLVGSILFGMKWIVDNKTTRLLITIHDAWKNNRQDEVNKLFDESGRFMRR